MMKLMYITSDTRVAQAAQKAGVDWIFVDLEVLGKDDRQGHLDTVISRHSLEDVKAIRSVLTESRLLVRVNPLHPASAREIDSVISAGADIVMLPFFESAREVAEFIEIVSGRALTCLLVETPGAVHNLSEIIEVPGIDFVHVGLNDLHLGYKLRFMFEPLANGTVDRVALLLRSAGIEFGFGGIARLGAGVLPAEKILAEHRRVGSTMVILSRSFLPPPDADDSADLPEVFYSEVNRIRTYLDFLDGQESAYFEANRIDTARTVVSIAQGLGG